MKRRENSKARLVASAALVLVDGRCITWFRHKGAWSWSISADGAEPLWSERIHASEIGARRDAWETLVTYYEGPKEGEG